MTLRVTVEPALLIWACERNRRDVEDYAARFPKLRAWVEEAESPTLRQLEDFARATSTSVGFFFLPAPPIETLPIRDFRRMARSSYERPSPELLDTIRDCQARQEWFRDFAIATREPPLAFVGSASVADDVVETAQRIRRLIRLDDEARSAWRTWEEALGQLAELLEAAGVLVMRSGCVGTNTSRKLEPEEFRGFTLADDRAPVVFVNTADTKAAQMFTLAHELAHVWLGQTGVSDESPVRLDGDEVERWCNQVAAELLVPVASLRAEASGASDVPELQRLGRLYKVSTLVILRRLHEIGVVTRDELWPRYQAELQRLREASTSSSGGDFYRVVPVRVSRRFARAIVISTLEGQTLYRDAFRMLGVSGTAIFDKLATTLGVT